MDKGVRVLVRVRLLENSQVAGSYRACFELNTLRHPRGENS